MKETSSVPRSAFREGAPSRNPLRRLYHWVLSWAESRYGEAALCGLSFIESSCFPIPPDVLLIPLVLGSPRRAVRLATLCTVASVLGGLAGYWIGHSLWYTGTADYSPLAQWCFGHMTWAGLTQQGFEHTQVLYREWNFWIVFIAAFTPIPYKLITITAGAFHVDLVLFTIASVIGRGARFFLFALLLRRFGDPMREWIERHFNWLTVAATAMLIGGFVVIKRFL